MQVAEFDYHLPEELIAQTPCARRDASRLLVLDRRTGALAHRHFYDLGAYLRPGDVLVFNDTRVIPARLIGAKAETGGKVEIFLLRRTEGDEWEALVKPGKKARPGTIVEFGESLRCEVLSDTAFGGRIVRFSYEGIFEEILDRLGQTPLPPYIKQTLVDKERYQTVYARACGSAAAPTAGLHFTQPLLDSLKAAGVELGFLTLHVGLGTFRPVQAEEIEAHVMHSEYYEVPPETAALVNAAKAEGRRVIAIGTTAIRTLESAAKEKGVLSAESGWTDIFIYPGYAFKIVDAMVTNFHLPKSTLLMLISAFAGREKVLAAYETAIAERYRFFSFGDAMLIL